MYWSTINYYLVYFRTGYVIIYENTTAFAKYIECISANIRIDSMDANKILHIWQMFMIIYCSGTIADIEMC